MMWEATDECVGFVTEFLTAVSEGRRDNLALPVSQDDRSTLAEFVSFLTPAMELFANWPWMLAGAGVDTMTIARQSIYFGGKAQFGDGKPIILVPELSSHLPFLLLSNWLKVLGYRPVTDGSVRECRRPIGHGFDTRHHPTYWQKGGPGSHRHRNAARIGNGRSQ